MSASATQSVPASVSVGAARAQAPDGPLTVNLDFGAAGHLYATHRLHAFAARCPPPLARWAIERYSSPSDVVLDPMCGSGTTLIETALTGRRSWGVDIDPLARLVAQAKSVPADPAAIRDLAAAIEARLAAGVDDDGWRPDLPNLSKWFDDQVAADLARLRVLLSEAAPADPARTVAWAAFSSLIVARTSVANARDLVHSRHHYQAKEEVPDVGGRYVKTLRRAASLHEDFGRLLVEAGHAGPDPLVVGTDARNLPVDDGSVALVFTSPPYCSALDYTRAHMFAVAWMPEVLGCSAGEYRALGRDYVGSDRAPLAKASAAQPLPPPSGYDDVDAAVNALAESPKRAWIVARYFADMAAVLAECARVVRPGGRVVLVVCPSNIRKVPIPTHQLFASMAAPATGSLLSVEAMHERTIHDHRRVMPYLEASFGSRMRTEYVLVLTRRLGRS